MRPWDIVYFDHTDYQDDYLRVLEFFGHIRNIYSPAKA
jgi:hypothetical protein